MLYVLIAIIIILSAFCFYLNFKAKKVVKLNTEVEKINNELNNENKKLVTENSVLSHNNFQLRGEENTIKEKIQILKEQVINQEENNEIIFNQSKHLLEERMDTAALEEAEKYQQASETAKEEYLSFLHECAEDAKTTLEIKAQELKNLQTQINEYKAKAQAFIKAEQRKEELQLNKDKYRVLVTDLDIKEIASLNSIIPILRNARHIYKVIWEAYYRDATNTMINRVLGNKKVCGIYKITNINNNKCYIGQSVDIAERWKQHLKAGCGIDAPNNKLYTAMYSERPESFTFELLEECPREKLNERETYWIEFYDCKIWGYNETKGGSKK